MTHQTRLRQYRRLHLHRISWFSFMLIGLLLVQLAYNLQVTGNFRVLAYATNVATQDLHTLTNKERSANGLVPLSLNAMLNQAAQAKAEHMIANDYWSHVAPDGTTPWYFIDQAGYHYINAGENLAYGFLDSSGAVQGWMDSPGHRANILGDYADVGFGYANGKNYQGGENTVIVAMYGTAPTAPVAVQTEPAPPSPPAPAPQPTPQVQAVEQPAAPIEVEPEPATPIQTQSASGQDKTEPAPSLSAPSSTDTTTMTSNILSGAASWPVFASLAVISISAIGFATTHVRLVRRGWDLGMRYAVSHPLTDAAVAGSVALLFLSTTVGTIH